MEHEIHKHSERNGIYGVYYGLKSINYILLNCKNTSNNNLSIEQNDLGINDNDDGKWMLYKLRLLDSQDQVKHVWLEV